MLLQMVMDHATVRQKSVLKEADGSGHKKTAKLTEVMHCAKLLCSKLLQGLTWWPIIQDVQRVLEEFLQEYKMAHARKTLHGPGALAQFYGRPSSSKPVQPPAEMMQVCADLTCKLGKADKACHVYHGC